MKNQFVTHGDTVYIILPPGDQVARIDIGDLDRIDAYPGMWRLHGRYLEMCHLDTFYRMRRVVLNLKDEKDFVIMHRDGDALNLKRDNLVLAPRGTHVQNRDKPNKNNRSSGVRGVTWHKKAEKWMATCTVDRKTRYLGLYPTLDEAKHAAEEARRVHMPLSTEHLTQKGDPRND